MHTRLMLETNMSKLFFFVHKQHIANAAAHLLQQQIWLIHQIFSCDSATFSDIAVVMKYLWLSIN